MAETEQKKQPQQPDMASLLLGNLHHDPKEAAKPVGSIGQAQLDADPKASKAPTTEARDQVCYTNIIAAQNQLDELLAKLKSAGKKPPAVGEISQSIVNAALFMAEANGSSFEIGKPTELLTAAMSSCSQTIVEVQAALTLLDDDHKLVPLTQLGQVMKSEAPLAKKLGASAAKGARVSTLSKGLDGKMPEVEAVKASLHLVDLEAQRGFDGLAATPTLDKGGSDQARIGVINTTVQLTAHHLSTVASLLPSFQPDQLAALKPSVEAASASFLRMQRWVVGRSAKTNMLIPFSPATSQLNVVRTFFKLPAFDLDGLDHFSVREEEEEKDEGKMVESAKSDFERAWNIMHHAMNDGIDQWFELAQLDDSKQPSFMETLLASAIDFAAGKVGNMMVGMILKGLNMKEKDSEKAKGVMEKGVELLSGKAAAALGIGEASSSPKPDMKSLVAVRAGLKAAVGQVHEGVGANFQDQIAKSTIGVASMKSMTAAVNGAMAKAPEQQKVIATGEWVRYTARAGLKAGGIDQKDGAATTNLEGYYGHMTQASYGKGGHPAERVGSHQGSVGMLRVEAKDFAGFNDPLKGAVRITKFDLNGLNQELNEILLGDPGALELKDVKVPKEIHFTWRTHEQRASFHDTTAKWVLDENNKVIDMIIDGEDGVGRLRGDALSTILHTNVHSFDAK